MPKRVILLILDGWGHSPDTEWNAIAKGETPIFDQLDKTVPHTLIDASGEEVGLPAGQMGNSEVGHLNIGSGRVVYQDLMRVTKAIEDRSFFQNKAIVSAFERAVKRGSAVHLCGLLSDGGVHSHMDHLKAYLELGGSVGVEKVYIHAFMDGRDTPPDSGLDYIRRLNAEIKRIGLGRISTVTGRFYAMDRDNRWDRVKRAYNLMVHGAADRYRTAEEAVRGNYGQGVTDEFIEPSLIVADGGEPGIMREGDEVLMFNFRADRMREIVRAFYDKGFSEFYRDHAPVFNVTCLTEYDARFALPVAFENHVPEMGLGQVISGAGMKQLRTAETEKYAHVTFFFNGGLERPFEGETRKLVPSPKVRTYDMKPEMSCPEVTDVVVDALSNGGCGLIVVNLANGDMVGHTGVWEAALRAVKTVDTSVGKIVEAARAAGVDTLITADHGNIETMKLNGKPMTAHTTNPVPLYYVGGGSYRLREGGRLADIAPTVLKLLDLPKPDQMTGEPLLI